MRRNSIEWIQAGLEIFKKYEPHFRPVGGPSGCPMWTCDEEPVLFELNPAVVSPEDLQALDSFGWRPYMESSFYWSWIGV